MGDGGAHTEARRERIEMLIEADEAKTRKKTGASDVVSHRVVMESGGKPHATSLPVEGAPASLGAHRSNDVEKSSGAHVDPNSSGGEPHVAIPTSSSTPADIKGCCHGTVQSCGYSKMHN